MLSVLLGVLLLVSSPPARSEAEPRSPSEGDSADAGFREEYTQDALRPLAAVGSAFVVTDGENQGEQVPLTVRRSEADGIWKIALEGVRESYVRQGEDGRLYLTDLKLLDKGYWIEYDPPVLFLPGRIQPDTTVEQKVRATVWNLEGSEQEGSGTARHRVGVVGKTSLSTPAGDFEEVIVVRMHQELDLDFASVSMTVTHGYAPDVGRVYQQIETTTEKLGLFGDTSQTTYELADRTVEGS